MSNLPVRNTSLVVADAPQKKGKGPKPPEHWFKLATALIEKLENFSYPLSDRHRELQSAWRKRDDKLTTSFAEDTLAYFYLYGEENLTSNDVEWWIFDWMDKTAKEILGDMKTVWPGFNVFSLSRSFVSARLDKMIEAINVGYAQPGDNYTDMLINHVEKTKPCAVALETACRSSRRK